MEIRPLNTDEKQRIELLVREQLTRSFDSTGSIAAVPGGLYIVEWQVNALDRRNLDRLKWLYSELGFETKDIRTYSVPSDIKNVNNDIFVLFMQRRSSLLSDYLIGEALAIESLAICWNSELANMGVPTDSKSDGQALASLYGPIGRFVS